MKLLSLMIALIGCVLGVLPAHAADPSCVVGNDHPLIAGKRWYGLYFEDRKIGHAMTDMAFEPLESGAPDRQVIAQRFAMTFKLEQAEETIEQVRRFQAHPPHRLLDGVYRTPDRTIAYRQVDGDLRLEEDGLTRVWRGLDRDLCDEEDVAIHAFLESRPNIGASIDTVDFDVEHQVLTKANHRLDEVSTRKLLGVDHLFQDLRTSSSSDAFSYTARSRFQNGEAINLYLGPIEFRAESEAIAHEPNQGVDLFAEFEKPLNRPLTRLSEIETLTLKAIIDDPAVTIDEVLRDGFGQRVDYLDDRTALVHLGDYPAPPGDGQDVDYLRSTSSHPADHPRVRAIADEIEASLGANTDARSLAKAILDYVAAYIQNVPESPYAYHTTSVFDVLDNRTGDCTEHSQLFVTLARAAGLPAREISGFVYGGDDSAPSLGGHAWVEVLIDGHWIGLDPTWKETDLNRSHVQTRNNLVPSLAFDVVDITYR
ncbi:MAG: transglutaminase-like domain-containing protein [Alphaproteobacteria bacterium]